MISIPHVAQPNKWVEMEFVDSPFVEIVSDDFFDVKMQYPLLGMKKCEEHCLVRKEVYERLILVRDFLPTGYKLRIWDAWRPLSLQKELFEEYSEDIVERFNLAECSEDEKHRVISKYVSLPKEDRDEPPVHTTGGAIDVTLIDEKGNELDMGTAFDSFLDSTATSFYEDDSHECIITENRRILYFAMTSAGFTNLPSEWWHYDYGDRFWAYYNRKPAMYRGCFERMELTGV